MTRHQRSTLFSSRQTVLRNTPCWSFTLKSTSPGGPTHSHAGSHRPGVSRQKLSWVTLVLLGGGYQPWPCRAALEPAALPLCALPPYPPPGRHRSLMDGWCRSRPNPADTHSVVTHTETSRYVFTLWQVLPVDKWWASWTQLDFLFDLALQRNVQLWGCATNKCAKTPTQSEVLNRSKKAQFISWKNKLKSCGP